MDQHNSDYKPQGEYTTVYHAVQNMESKDRPKRQALSRDAGRDMNADGEAACENNDVGYVNEVNGSTKVMGVRKRTTLGVCQWLKYCTGDFRKI